MGGLTGEKGFDLDYFLRHELLIDLVEVVLALVPELDLFERPCILFSVEDAFGVPLKHYLD